MPQYIDKDALVAEIERRIKGLEDCHADTVAGYEGEISGLKRLLSFLDTLEVKAMDLKKEVDSQMDLLKYIKFIFEFLHKISAILMVSLFINRIKIT